MSINGKNFLRLEFLLAVIWVLQSEFLQMIFIYAKNVKKLQNMLF